MSNKNTRELFESILLTKGYKPETLAKDECGRFKDKKVVSLYRGFLMYEKAVFNGAVKSMGVWVIAEVRNNKSYNFSKTPKWHFTYPAAKTECDRLALEHGKRFAMFKRMYITDPLNGVEDVSEDVEQTAEVHQEQ